MSYRWEDLQTDRLEVEWGENLHVTRRPRRPTTLRGRYGRAAEGSGPGWLSVTVVVMSTLAAVGIASMVALTMVRSPIPRRGGGGNPSKAEGALPAPVVPEANNTSAPTTHRPSAGPTSTPTTPRPTLRPTWTPKGWRTARPTAVPTAGPSRAPSPTASAPPSIVSSGHPSQLPSVAPTGVPKAPPAPGPCVDAPGFHRNHVGDKVSCDWFSTVGTYNLERNCGRTDVGRACLFACREYVDCIVATERPSRRPTSSPSSSAPTAGPTPRPPKRITLVATGDASIKEAVPNANLGSASWLKIDTAPLPLPQDPPNTVGTGAFHALMRFDLSKHDSNRLVESALLRVKAANSCSSGGILRKTNSPHWDEHTVTWENAPEGDGNEIGRLGIIKKGFWYPVDVTSALHKGHKTLSLRLYPVSSDECLFVSKDNSNGGGPELHIIYGDV